MEGNYLLILFIVWPFAAAIIAYLSEKKSSRTMEIITTSAVAAELGVASFLLFGRNGMDLTFIWHGFAERGIRLEISDFRMAMCVSGCGIWFLCALTGMKTWAAKKEGTNKFFLLLTLGAVMGLFLSADLFTLFIFFEILSLSSYVLIANKENGKAVRASNSYMAYGIIGGMVLLMGLLLLDHAVGTMEIGQLIEACRKTEYPQLLFAAGVCMFIGFSTKAAVFPLHTWLAPVTESAVSWSGILFPSVLAKTGIFGILILCTYIFRGNQSWGNMMAAFGMLSMLFGGIRGMFATGMKQFDACVCVFQNGFLLIAMGAVSLNGKYAENILSCLIFYILGQLLVIVLLNAKTNKVIMLFAGLLNIILPFLNIHVAASLSRFKAVWVLLVVASAFMAAGHLKFLNGIFHNGNFHKNSGSLKILAGVLFVLLPAVNVGKPAWEVKWICGIFLIITVALGAFIYLAVVRKHIVFRDTDGTVIYKDRWPRHFDLEKNVYYPLIFRLLPFLCAIIFRVFDRLVDSVVFILHKTLYKPKKKKKALEFGTRTTHTLGSMADYVVYALNHTILRRHPIKMSFVEALALTREEMDQTTRLVSRSLSFSLLLFCVGLIVTLFYLLGGI